MTDTKKLQELRVMLRPARPEDFLMDGGAAKYRFGKQFMVKMEDDTWRMERLEDTVVSKQYFSMIFKEGKAFVVDNANDIGNIQMAEER